MNVGLNINIGRTFVHQKDNKELGMRLLAQYHYSDDARYPLTGISCGMTFLSAFHGLAALVAGSSAISPFLIAAPAIFFPFQERMLNWERKLYCGLRLKKWNREMNQLEKLGIDLKSIEMNKDLITRILSEARGDAGLMSCSKMLEILQLDTMENVLNIEDPEQRYFSMIAFEECAKIIGALYCYKNQSENITEEEAQIKLDKEFPPKLNTPTHYSDPY